MKQLLLNISPDWIPALDNFVAGRNTELLSVLHQSLSANSSERSLYLWGEPGCGKTHLLQAVVEQAKKLGRTAIYARGVVPEGADVIALDEVESLGESLQIALFELYNRVRENGGLLLVSGSLAPAQLLLRDDLRTRLGWGLIYHVQGLSDEEKGRALLEHARAKGFDLSNEVIQYLLIHGRRDLPSLLAVLDSLDTQCLLLKRSPTVPLLKEVMQSGKSV
jgi:DnaA family protein